MNTNRAFDTLCAKLNVTDAVEHLGHWGRALVRTDLSADDVSFLAGSFRNSVQNVRNARWALETGNY